MTSPGITAARAQERLREMADAALYGSYSTGLLRIVARQVRTTPEDVEDACHFAWAQYLSHAEQIDRDHAHAWLATAAVRHAVELHSRAARVSSVEEELEHGTEPVAGDDPGRIAELREQLALVDRLPVRQRGMLYRQAAGLSYAEISQRTGDSLRTVERQLSRAHRRLTELQRPPAQRIGPLTTGPRRAPTARL